MKPFSKSVWMTPQPPPGPWCPGGWSRRAHLRLTGGEVRDVFEQLEAGADDLVQSRLRQPRAGEDLRPVGGLGSSAICARAPCRWGDDEGPSLHGGLHERLVMLVPFGVGERPLVDVRDEERRLVREEVHLLHDRRRFGVVRQRKGARGLALARCLARASQRSIASLSRGLFALIILRARSARFCTVSRSSGRASAGHGRDVGHRIDAVLDVGRRSRPRSSARPAPRRRPRGCAEELVAEALAPKGPADQARDVDEVDGRRNDGAECTGPGRFARLGRLPEGEIGCSASARLSIRLRLAFPRSCGCSTCRSRGRASRQNRHRPLDW